MDSQSIVALFAMAVGFPALIMVPLLMFLLRALHEIDRRLSRLESNGN